MDHVWSSGGADRSCGSEYADVRVCRIEPSSYCQIEYASVKRSASRPACRRFFIVLSGVPVIDSLSVRSQVARAVVAIANANAAAPYPKSSPESSTSSLGGPAAAFRFQVHPERTETVSCHAIPFPFKRPSCIRLRIPSTTIISTSFPSP